MTNNNRQVNKPLPFSQALLHTLAAEYKTPLYIYDEQGIREQVDKLKQAFAWAKSYRNYFAVKATPTPAILQLLAEEGMGFDCSSLTELTMVKEAGLIDKGIFYTSNNTPNEDYCYAQTLNAIINLDKVVYLEQIQEALGQMPRVISLRYNPGRLMAGNHVIGQPSEAKFGDTAEHILQAIGKIRQLDKQIKIGLHMMVVSNERRPEIFYNVASLLKRLVDKITLRYDISPPFINLGGGFGINYSPADPPTDITAIGQAIEAALEDFPADIYTEAGRYLTGPHGYLLTSVSRGVVKSVQTFLTVDTSINNLNRLATVKDAYHFLSFIGSGNSPTQPMTVVGSMCNDSDRLFKNRRLPISAKPGDLLVIHDVGAHGRANATNYNGQLRCGEVLVSADGSHRLIRRHENVADLLATTSGLSSP